MDIGYYMPLTLRKLVFEELRLSLIFSGRTYGFYNIHVDLVIRLLIYIELIISYDCTSYLVEVYISVVRRHKFWPWLHVGPGLQLVRQTF